MRAQLVLCAIILPTAVSTKFELIDGCSTKYTYSECESTCAAADLRVPCLTSEADNSALYVAIDSYYNSDFDTWISISSTNTAWEWPDYCASSYTNWMSNPPTGASICAVMLEDDVNAFGGASMWSTTGCSSDRCCACESNFPTPAPTASPAPTPAPTPLPSVATEPPTTLAENALSRIAAWTVLSDSGYLDLSDYYGESHTTVAALGDVDGNSVPDLVAT